MYYDVNKIPLISRTLILLSHFILGEDSLMYMYLQKQFSWTLENYTLFNAYATLLSGLLIKLYNIL